MIKITWYPLGIYSFKKVHIYSLFGWCPLCPWWLMLSSWCSVWARFARWESSCPGFLWWFCSSSSLCPWWPRSCCRWGSFTLNPWNDLNALGIILLLEWGFFSVPSMPVMFRPMPKSMFMIPPLVPPGVALSLASIIRSFSEWTSLLSLWWFENGWESGCSLFTSFKSYRLCPPLPLLCLLPQEQVLKKYSFPLTVIDSSLAGWKFSIIAIHVSCFKINVIVQWFVINHSPPCFRNCYTIIYDTISFFLFQSWRGPRSTRWNATKSSKLFPETKLRFIMKAGSRISGPSSTPAWTVESRSLSSSAEAGSSRVGSRVWSGPVPARNLSWKSPANLHTAIEV